jgi:hypothetical protein
MANYYDCVTEYLRGQIDSLLSEIGFLASLDLDSLRHAVAALAARGDLDFENLEDARRGLEGIRVAIRDGRSYAVTTIATAVRLAGAADREDPGAEQAREICRDTWEAYLRQEGIKPLHRTDGRETIQ